MGTVIDLDDLVDVADPGASDAGEPVTLRLRGVGDVTVAAVPPPAFIAAIGRVAWATQHGTDQDRQDAGIRLVSVLVDVVGDRIAAKASTKQLVRGLMAAWQMPGEVSASSD